MADQATIDYYVSWKHEKNRAVDLGKTNYATNCQVEIDRLLGEYPELSSENCDCGVYTGCTG